MNTISINATGHARARPNPLKPRPFDQWSFRTTLLIATVLAALVFALGVQCWRTSGLIDLGASRAALTAAQEQSEHARDIAAELPELRKRADLNRLQPDHWTSADALHAVAALAAQSGLRVTGIEPMQPKGIDRKPLEPPVDRALSFRAEGAFPEIRRFIESVAGLPRLVVPENVQIKRQNGALTIDTTLRIHETLPAVPLPQPVRANAFVIDPFGKDSAGDFGRGADMLLVGTLVSRQRAMALVQSGHDIDDFRPGQKIGDERLGRVVPREIELARDDGVSRTLTIAEERK